ncbi:MAG: nitrile hydratase subunit beta [Candidatus Binataceae bacterium]|jgi:nitrile hydratase
MNGVHDMGAMDGFGRVEHGEPGDSTPFHSDWEARAFALINSVLVRLGANVDEFRHAIERIPPARYLASGYYERWLHAAQTLLVEKGILSRRELDARAGSEIAAIPAAQVAPAKPRAKNPRAKFRTAQRVRARNINPAGHTRLARYVRGKIGVIRRDWGIYVFPDTNAHHAGEARQHVYNVAFKARELFGPSAHPRDEIVIDLWEDYLEPAGSKPAARPAMKKSKRKSRAATRRKETRHVR